MLGMRRDDICSWAGQQPAGLQKSPDAASPTSCAIHGVCGRLTVAPFGSHKLSRSATRWPSKLTYAASPASCAIHCVCGHLPVAPLWQPQTLRVSNLRTFKSHDPSEGCPFGGWPCSNTLINCQHPRPQASSSGVVCQTLVTQSKRVTCLGCEAFNTLDIDGFSQGTPDAPRVTADVLQPMVAD